MSLALSALSVALRLLNKPYLARATDLPAMRRRLERIAPLLAPDPDGADYRQKNGLLRAGPRRGDAAILYLHGGAFVLCSPATHRHLAAALALAAGAPAVIPAYRLAPEHPHPAQIDDAAAAYAALVTEGRRVAVAGDSAGGGLAFALTLATRARGLPDPACVVGFSPWCDMTLSSPTLRANAASDAMLPASRIDEVAGMRMGAGDRADPLASPVFARFDRPPPPALIFASRAEILAGDAEAMAARWTAQGGAAEIVWEDEAPHAWPIFAGVAPEADAAVARAGAFVARHLEPGSEERP